MNTLSLDFKKLNKKLVTAQKSYVLLKSRKTALNLELSKLENESQNLHFTLSKKIETINYNITLAKSVMSEEQLALAFLTKPKDDQEEKQKREKISKALSFLKLDLDLEFFSFCENFSFGYAFTAIELDKVIENLPGIINNILTLYEKEKRCREIKEKIKQIEQRMNVLTLSVIPKYKKEIERTNIKREKEETNEAYFLNLRKITL